MEPTPIRVLLVEDSPTDALLARAALEDDRQFRLAHADRLGAALDLLRAGAFDVVLLDLGLPDSEGMDTLARLRRANPAVAVVVMTGHDDERLGLRAIQEGAQDYLVKGEPESNALARAVRHANERKRTQDDLRRANERLEHALEELRGKERELRATSQQLWQAARLAGVGELAASIAHELNNPLATVSLRLEGLLAKTPAVDPRRKALDVIDGEVQRMAGLVANLLGFSRAGREQVSAVDLGEEAAKTVDLIDHHLRNRRVIAEADFSPAAPAVNADRQQVRQILLNLLTNAGDAMPDGGRLAVRVRPGDLAGEPAAVLEVADTGTGIPAEHLERIFDPFFTTKEEGQGTGLGLAICRRIVGEHHGTLEVESTVGVGTTFRLTFPVRTVLDPNGSHPG